MHTQPDKPIRGLRKRLENLKSVGNSSPSSILPMRSAQGTLLRLGVPSLNVRREKQAVDLVFQTLLTNANQELARLLRDLRRLPQSGLPQDRENRQSVDLLIRAVHCATKQYMVQAELGNLALKDELTGFYNRRAFDALAERQLKLGRRSGRGMLLFFIDVDGLKQINDSLGHKEGDRALERTAETLKKTFRDSDVIGRLGGDEFAVLAVEASGHSEASIMTRLQGFLHATNAQEAQYNLSLSVGVARFDHNNPVGIGELLAQADQAMYEQKRRRSSLQMVQGTSSTC